jgi:hypothetical protein
LTPYYRAYFGKPAADSFFVEGFSMVNSEVELINYYDDKIIKQQDKDFTDFALGFGLFKMDHKKGFVFEIMLE